MFLLKSRVDRVRCLVVNQQWCSGKTAYWEMAVGRICLQQAVIRKRVSAWNYRMSHLYCCLPKARLSVPSHSTFDQLPNSIYILFTANTYKTLTALLYVQVTAHRDKLHIKQPTRCIKYPKFILSQNSTCFGHICAHHQELSTVHPAIGTFHAGYVTASKFTRILLGSVAELVGKRKAEQWTCSPFLLTG